MVPAGDTPGLHFRSRPEEVPAGPPAAGWWQANDGNWYPPETNPGQVDSTIDLTEGAGEARCDRPARARRLPDRAGCVRERHRRRERERRRGI